MHTSNPTSHALIEHYLLAESSVLLLELPLVFLQRRRFLLQALLLCLQLLEASRRDPKFLQGGLQTLVLRLQLLNLCLQALDFPV